MIYLPFLSFAFHGVDHFYHSKFIVCNFILGGNEKTPVIPLNLFSYNHKTALKATENWFLWHKVSLHLSFLGCKFISSSRHLFVSFLESLQNYMDTCKDDLINLLEFQVNLSLYIIKKLIHSLEKPRSFVL